MRALTILGGTADPPLPPTAGEVWGCNSLWALACDRRGAFKATRWFELHPRAVNTAEEQRAVVNCQVPIYVLDAGEWPDCPRAVTYPLDRVRSLLPDGRDFFCSTFAYQLALAVLEGFQAIALRGLDLSLGTRRERTVEKGNLEYWIGFARGRGVVV